MALGDPGFYGTNSDDSRNEDYCIYCFAGGEFNEELTMEEMIEQCAEMYAMNSGGDAAAVEAARTHMTELFPHPETLEKSSPFSDTDTDYRRKKATTVPDPPSAGEATRPPQRCGGKKEEIRYAARRQDMQQHTGTSAWNRQARGPHTARRSFMRRFTPSYGRYLPARYSLTGR